MRICILEYREKRSRIISRMLRETTQKKLIRYRLKSLFPDLLFKITTLQFERKCTIKKEIDKIK